MKDKEEDLLKQIAYLSEGMFDCEVNSNIGDAKEWKHKLHQATDNYYNYIFGAEEDEDET